MDDFFLRPAQQTPQRLAQTGGNVDYERFYEEVLLPLQAGISFSYRPYDCHTLQFREPVCIQPRQVNILEGSYSLHPYFSDPYDLKIFLTVSEVLQRARIEQRPAFLHRRFFEEWIPMEERYFHHLQIRDNCDICLG